MAWQVQEAKQRFSEVVRAAQAGEPQVVTRHGEEIVVILDISEYRQLRGESTPLMDYLVRDRELDVELDIDRRRDEPRLVDLS
jgi:prevent-host-death family protein